MRLLTRSLILLTLLANAGGLAFAAKAAASESTSAGPSVVEAENTTEAGADSLNVPQPSAEAIVAAFQAAGLPIGDSIVYTATSDPNDRLGRPGQYTGKASWADTRIEQPELADGPTGGTVEVFAAEDELAARRDYIKSVQQSMPMLQQYIFESGNALLRLEFALTPEQAAEYERVLRSLYE